MTVTDADGARLAGWASRLVYMGPIAGRVDRGGATGDGPIRGESAGSTCRLSGYWLGVGLRECRDLLAGADRIEIAFELSDLGLAVRLPVRLSDQLCRPVTGGVRIELIGTVVGPVRRMNIRGGYEIYQS